jgi:hypothetical protein
MSVFHFSDTRFLYSIVGSGVLRPNPYCTWFDRAFVWGSTVPSGDRTATPLRLACGPDRVLGHTKMIRFTFPDTAFTTWEEIKRVYTKTKKHIAQVKEAEEGHKESGVDVNKWRLRIEPLPIASALLVEAKGYGARERWRPIDMSPGNLYEGFESCAGDGWFHPGADGDEGPTTTGFVIDGVVYGKTLLRAGSSRLYDFDSYPDYWVPTSFPVPTKSRRAKYDW